MRHLSPAFKHHYGPTSLFVRVTADVITLACAGAMTQRSLLAESDPIARVAPNEAIITFKRVLDARFHGLVQRSFTKRLTDDSASSERSSMESSAPARFESGLMLSREAILLWQRGSFNHSAVARCVV